MAVIVKYVVVRDGDEKMTFATKKEADAHDKMLDIADTLRQYLKAEKLQLDEDQMDELSLCLARDKGVILQILRGGKMPPPENKKEPDRTEASSEPSSPKAAAPSAKKKTAAIASAKSAADADVPNPRKKSAARSRKKG